MQTRVLLATAGAFGFVICTALRAQTPAPPADPPLLATVPTPPPGTASVPQAMAGAPLQVGDLPPGTITVRVIRGDFAHNVANQVVTLHIERESRVLTATTGPEGRAQFVGVAVGGSVWTEATVDGERLTSQTFQVPSRGGVRLVLSTVTSPDPGAQAGRVVMPVLAATQAGPGTQGASVSGTKSYPQMVLPGLFAAAGIGFGVYPFVSRRSRKPRVATS